VLQHRGAIRGVRLGQLCARLGLAQGRAQGRELDAEIAGKGVERSLEGGHVRERGRVRVARGGDDGRETLVDLLRDLVDVPLVQVRPALARDLPRRVSGRVRRPCGRIGRYSWATMRRVVSAAAGVPRRR
jgi:hypothetical protein